jgi:hypothetical protein
MTAKTQRKQSKTTYQKRIGFNYVVEVRSVFLDDGTEMYQPIVVRSGHLVFSSGLMTDKEATITWAIMAYHDESGDLRDLLKSTKSPEIDIDPDLIREHPKNKEVYEDEDYTNLIKFMDVEEPEVSRIEINERGLVVKGNRRTHVAKLLNERNLAEGKEPKFPRLPIRVKLYASEDDEMKSLLLDNAGQREKTLKQKLNEWNLYLAIEKRKGRQRMSMGASLRWASDDDEAEALKEFNEDKGKRSGDVSAKQAGLGSESSARTGKKVNTYAEQVKKSHPVLSDGLRKISNKSINAGHELMKISEEKGEDFAERVVRKIESTPSTGKKVKIKEAIAEVLKEATEQEMGDKQPETYEDRIKIYEGYSDTASNNWYTPDDIIKMVQDVYGEEGITTDMFADLTKRVPAKNHITIVENALEPRTKVEGNVWANILYSKQRECFEAINRGILRGDIKRICVLAEAGVLSNQGTQPIIEAHKFLALAYRGRIDFIPGEYLEYKRKKERESRLREIKDLTSNENATLDGQEPEVETLAAKNSRINSVFLFYDSVGDRIDQFIKIFGARGQIWYPKSATSTLSPEIFDLPWEDDKQVFLGHLLSVSELSNGLWEARIDGEFADDASPDKESAKAMALSKCILQLRSIPSLYF